MQNLFADLQELLAQDDRLVAEDGTLLKNLVIELGLKLDPALLRLLLSHDRIRQHFFAEVDGILVFDKDKFLQFVNNKAFLPDSYTAFKNKIGLSDDSGDTLLSHRRDVALVWPYKDCVLEGGQTQEDAKRDEIFWNTTLAPDDIVRLLDPKVLTGWQRYDAQGAHPVTALRPADNLIIKGNNLLALHSLARRFAGKVKLIYIDPPFNTGSDGFRYNDNFNHSTWLTFMQNRLSVAKRLLAPAGIVLVQCSFHEYAYLKVLMDELFKKYLCTFHIQVRHPERILTGDKEYNDIIEYILVYSNDSQTKLPKIQEEKTDQDYVYQIEELGQDEELLLGEKRVAVITPTNYRIIRCPSNSTNLKTLSIRGSIREKNSSGRFYVSYLEGLVDRYPPATLFRVPGIGDDGLGYRYFYSPPEGNKNGGYYQGKPQSSDITLKPYPNFFNYEQQYNNVANEGGVGFRNGKKPEQLIQFLIDIFTDAGEIILDYYVGSGTTAAVAHKMKRQYIGIEQMDYIDTITLERLKNVVKDDPTGISKDVGWQGGGDFVYCELLQWNERFVRRIEAATSTAELQTLWQEMQTQAFLSYRVDVAVVNANAGAFADLTLDEQKRFLLETLDYNALYVNLSEIADADYAVSDEDQRLNRQFYQAS